MFPFIAAVTLLDGGATLKQFTDEKMKDTKVRELMSKVKVYRHSSLPDMPDPTKISASEMARMYITLRLATGEEYSCWAEGAKGFAEKPFTKDELIERYRSFASLVLPSRSIDKTIEIINSLEKVSDIGELMNLFRCG